MIRIALLLFSTPLFASNLLLDSNFIQVQNIYTLDCHGLHLFSSDPATQCTPADPPNPRECPVLIIDGVSYQFLHEIVFNVITSTANVTGPLFDSCIRQSNNAAPSLGAGFKLSSEGQAVLGIASMRILTDPWALDITSLDGDIVCADTAAFEIIFKHNFNGN